MYYNKVILVISHYFQQLINSQKQRLFCTYELILHYSFSDKSTIVFLVAYTSNLCDTKHFTWNNNLVYNLVYKSSDT